jgi:hypothetical protein
MSRHRKWHVRRKVSSVADTQQREGKQDEQDGLLVHVPPEQEGRVGGQRECGEKRRGRGVQEEIDQWGSLGGDGQEEC